MPRADAPGPVPPPSLSPGRPQGGEVRFADPALLDELRRLSPEERLRWNDRMATTALELRHAFTAARPHLPARPAGSERD